MRALACLSPKSADPSTMSLGLPDFDHLGLSYPSGYDRPSHCCVAAPACVPFARLLNTSSKAPTTRQSQPAFMCPLWAVLPEPLPSPPEVTLEAGTGSATRPC